MLILSGSTPLYGLLLRGIGTPQYKPSSGCPADSGPGLTADRLDPQIWVMVLVSAAPVPQLSCAGHRAGWPAARCMTIGRRPRVAGSTARHHAVGVAG